MVITIIGQRNKTKYSGDIYQCNICKSNLNTMFASGIEHDFFTRHQAIGGGRREHVICPVCRSFDRERFVYYYLEQKTDIFTGKNTVLHFAPEKLIEKRIRINTKCDYYTGDIVPGRADYVVDITNNQFSDSMFDYIICNHVLEHIPNEAQAVSELKRVLKKDGVLLLSVPVSISDKETIENSNIVTPEDRLNTFGQKNHVRLYGLDIIDRLSKYGLNVTEFNSEKDICPDLVKKYGMITGDRLYICTKNSIVSKPSI